MASGLISGQSATTKTVVCVLNVGKFRNRTYSPIWAQRLKNMVGRHLGEHRFVCFSNVEVEGVETIQLRDGLPGWWGKVEMFRPGVLDGRVLYIDLDVVVLGDLDPLFEVEGDFVAMKADVDWPTRISEGKRVTAGLNSGTMAWDAGAVDCLYTDFRHHLIDELRGDQDWITEHLEAPAFFPREWFARLRDCQHGVPDGVRVLHCMPWKNDVAVRKFDWIRDLWV